MLIYNAGAEPKHGPFLDHDLAMIRDRLRRNIVVKTELVHHFGREMRARRRGGIVLMGSISGYFGNPGFAAYAGSKAYASLLTEGLWYELKEFGVNVLCPVVGLTRTPTMIHTYGATAQNAPDPMIVAKGALDNIANGPIWVADDMRDLVTRLNVMKPADRVVLAAEMAAGFFKGKAPVT